MVTAIVCDGSAGGGEAEPLGGAPWWSSMPYNMETAPTSSVIWSVPISCVGSSLRLPRRTLPLHLLRQKDLKATCTLKCTLRRAPQNILSSNVHIIWGLIRNVTTGCLCFCDSGVCWTSWTLLPSHRANPQSVKSASWLRCLENSLHLSIIP